MMIGMILPYAFCAPFVVIFTGVFLFYLFSWYSFFFILAFLLTTRFQKTCSSIKKVAVQKKKTASDQRIKITTQLVDGIRLIKMYGWEKPFEENLL